MATDFKRVLEKAESYKPAISRFLRDLIALPSESCQEKEVIRRIKQEMEAVGFDRVEIDPMGNVLGYIGTGRHLIAMDAHIDNVGVGNPENWKFDPFKGYEDDEVIGGRGASDQTGGMASLVYAGKIIKDLEPDRRLHPPRHRHRARGGLRRPLLAVHRGEERDPAGVRGLHRAHLVPHPSRPAGTDGDQGGRARDQRPRLGPGAGRQRHLQDGADSGRASGVARAPGARPLPGQGFPHRVRDLLHLAQPLRRGRRLHDLRGSPAHGRARPGRGPWRRSGACPPSSKPAHRSPSTTTPGRHTPAWFTRRSAISLAGYSRSSTPPARRSSPRTSPCLPRSRWWTSGPSPPTASPSWVATAFPAWASAPATRTRPMRPTSSPGRASWCRRRRCTQSSRRPIWQAAENGPSAALERLRTRCGVPGVRLTRLYAFRLAAGPF